MKKITIQEEIEISDFLLEKGDQISIMKEGIWAWDPQAAKRFLMDLKKLTKKYFSTVGDDDVWDGISNAESRIEDLLGNPPEFL